MRLVSGHPAREELKLTSNMFFCELLKILNNTFVGTFFAGTLLALLGFFLYGRQKRIDLVYEEIRKDRQIAASLYASIETASKKMEGLFNIYDGKNPHLVKPLQKLGLEFENLLVNKMSDELSVSNKEIATISENLITNMKIRNLQNLNLKTITDNVSIINFYLFNPSTLQKLTKEEVEEWRNGLGKATSSIESELKKILTP